MLRTCLEHAYQDMFFVHNIVITIWSLLQMYVYYKCATNVLLQMYYYKYTTTNVLLQMYDHKWMTL